MREYNVLILSAGRRVELLQSFKDAARKLNIKSKVIAGDCSETAPALYFADKAYRLPRIHEDNYIDSIIDVSQKENISIIIPTIDTDLLLLSENKEYIEKQCNAKVLISCLNVIKICKDKIATQKFLEENSFGVAKMYSLDEVNSNNVKFPLFIKPKAGSSSINTFKVNNSIELTLLNEMINEPIIQDYLEGDEYTVDVFLDFNSKIITIVPRLRMAIRSGEILKGKIVKDRNIIEDVKRLMMILKPIGHITVQLMKTHNGIKFIEINPRFGGGAPMSIRSGANSCENLYKLLMGQDLVYNEDYKDNLMFLRFDNSVCINKDMEIIK